MEDTGDRAQSIRGIDRKLNEENLAFLSFDSINRRYLIN